MNLLCPSALPVFYRVFFCAYASSRFTTISMISMTIPWKKELGGPRGPGVERSRAPIFTSHLDREVSSLNFGAINFVFWLILVGTPNVYLVINLLWLNRSSLHIVDDVLREKNQTIVFRLFIWEQQQGTTGELYQSKALHLIQQKRRAELGMLGSSSQLFCYMHSFVLIGNLLISEWFHNQAGEK